MLGDALEVVPVHVSVRGRARLKVPSLHARPDLEHALEEVLAGLDGIQTVSASAVTSNILVCYDPREDLAHVVDIVKIASGTVLGQPRRRPSYLAPRRTARRAPDLDQARGSSGVFGFFRELVSSLARKARAPSDHMPTAHELLRYAPPERMPVAWHAASPTELLAFWKSGHAGLTEAEARVRLARYGPNLLPHPEPRSAVRIFLDQFGSIPVLLLAGSAVLSVLTGGIGDAIVIGIVVLLNASIGAATEFEAEKTITALMALSEPVVTVIRDKQIQQVGGEQVVPGDVLVFRHGAHVVADARLLDTENLAIDESALTGESMPVEKAVAALPNENIPLAERLNIVYRGTIVTGGSGLGVVFGTGRHTEIGRIQQLMAESVQPRTPLHEQMDRLGNQLLWFTGIVSAAVLGLGILRGLNPVESLRGAISLAVAAIPEGLPTIATVALASGVRALARQRVLVRRLAAIEALGSVQVVCFDKTGTLTLNRMSVVALYAGLRRYEISGGKIFADSQPVQISSHAELLQLMETCSLCSEAELDDNGAAPRGSATETALVQMALDAGVDVARLRHKRPLQRVRHRASGLNFMLTEHHAGAGRRLIAVKGSPTEVLGLCSSLLRDGAIHPLGEAERRAIRSENERMAGAALRVLGAAFLDGAAENERGEGNLIWAGLAGIADPPRQGLRELISDFRNAGVRPVMLTGDQRATARAIGRALDLNGGGALEELDSHALDGLEAAELADQVSHVQIFSRVNPAQKLQIVRSLQGGGAVVAMTGDGVNDGPALKAADVGIALGQTGTRVAREVADILLTEDNVHALLPAIAEGRRVRANIRKSIGYIATTNMGEVLVTLAGAAAGFGQPLNARQLLWINVITDVFPELALAAGPSDPDVMTRPPDAPRRPVLDRGDYAPLMQQSGAMAAAALAAYGYGISRYGISPAASTMAFLTLTSAQLLHGFSGRFGSRALLSTGAPKNPYMNMAILGGYAALALSQFGLAGLLGTVRLGAADAMICAAASAASFLVNEAVRRPAAAVPALEAA